MARDKMKLRKDENEVFEAIRECGNIALMSGFHRGKRAAIIVAVKNGEAGEVAITPLAILVRPCDMDHLGDPEGVVPAAKSAGKD